ncbi:hypothetical protein I302_103706 [Kwoniella bestiolae CBS 10118]|uniref:Uncharacterized protein n=1 Tax=Kwoniella bestiolae CBS 10118 TaxID=1296100 RepID=A0AAJ8K643_9TREE
MIYTKLVLILAALVLSVNSTPLVERGPACPGGQPIVFPPKPPPPTLRDELFGNSSASIGTDFLIKVFNVYTTGIWVSSNGFAWHYSYDDNFHYTDSYLNKPLPTRDLPSYTIAPYWDALGSWPSSGDYIGFAWGTNTDSITINWKASLLSDRTQRLDFTLHYTTASPGVYWIWYDSVPSQATGGSATIGAQGGQPRKQHYKTYSYNTPGTVYPGLRLAIDTNCDGSITVG